MHSGMTSSSSEEEMEDIFWDEQHTFEVNLLNIIAIIFPADTIICIYGVTEFQHNEQLDN